MTKTYSNGRSSLTELTTSPKVHCTLPRKSCTKNNSDNLTIMLQFSAYRGLFATVNDLATPVFLGHVAALNRRRLLLRME